MKPELEKLLRETAEESCCTHEDVDMDWHGQDGFERGEHAGRVEFARELCALLEITFEMPEDDDDE